MTVRMLMLVSGLGVALGAPLALAQGSPSADQIIKSLKPGNGMMGGTRGIRPVAPSGPVAADPVEPAAPAHVTGKPASVPAKSGGPATTTTTTTTTVTTTTAPSVNLTVQFANGSADLTPGAVRTLSELGRALSSSTLATYRFRIEGHTDTVGMPEANRLLSERRAKTVVDFLASRFRIDPTRLDAAGLGEEGLLVQTPPNTPEPRNRRVQVINLGA